VKVIFVSMDTLRADRLGCLGHPGRLTPNLDRVAAEGAVFPLAFASDIPTQPSHTAVFTGRFGVNTGIVSHFHPRAHLEEQEPWLPSIFKERGYATGAVDHLFAMKDWFVRGYDDYMPPPGRSRSPGSVINQIAFPWIHDHREEDFFLFLHYWDAHIPYTPPSPFKERYTSGSVRLPDPLVQQKLRSRPSYPLFKRNLYDHLEVIPNLQYVADLYDAEVAYLDYELGRLFDHLTTEGVAGDTLVVLFGDHGEIMTEHDAWFDHAGLYDDVVHVPLLLWAPGLVPASKPTSMVELVDVMPTVLEVLGLPAVEGRDGRSLVPLFTEPERVHRDVVMLSEATWQAKRAVRTTDWKYIRCYDPGVYPRAGGELYHLAEDPDEQVNLIDERPEVAAELDDRLDHWLAAQLAGRTDPLLQVVDDGLPAVARLDGIINGDAPAPAPAAPTVVPAPADHLDAPTASNGHAPVAAVVAAEEVVAAAAAAAAAGAMAGGGPTASAEGDPPTAPLPVTLPANGNGGNGGNGTPVPVGGPPVPGAPMAAAVPPATGLTTRGVAGVLQSHAEGPADADQPFAPAQNKGFRQRAGRGVLVGGIAVLCLAVLAYAVDTIFLSAPLQASAQVKPASTASLNMAATGPVTSIRVSPGQLVQQGQVLATQDTTTADQRLTSDEAKLTGDQAALQALEHPAAPATTAPVTDPAQAAQLAAAVTTAQVTLASAQQKEADTASTNAANTAAAQNKLDNDQRLVSADQEQLAAMQGQCTSANPPASCATALHQYQQDQVQQSTDRAAQAQAQAQAQSATQQAQAAVAQAQAALSQAQAAQAAGGTGGGGPSSTTPTTDPAAIPNAQAKVTQDEAAINSDRATVAAGVLRAPFAGVVADVGCAVGVVVTSAGCHQASTPTGSAPSGSFQLFPQSAQAPASTSQPQTVSLIQLDSLGTEIQAQVPESDIRQIHAGEGVTISLAALPGHTYRARVSDIPPDPLQLSGQAYYLVDVVTTPRTSRAMAAALDGSGSQSGKLIGLSANVTF
jgi:arylsulfatase A-like enzyme/multidrug efflux pump subunit AcrA (membrane-fusion protein)